MAERGTLDRKKTFTAVVCHPSRLTLTGTIAGRGVGVGLKRRIPLKNLFNSLIENDKRSGTFSPVGEIKELELHKTQRYGSKPERFWLTLAN